MGKRSDGIRALALAGTSALLVVGVMADGTKIERNAAPAAVQAAIKTMEAQGSTVGKMELEGEDGKQVYSVELTKDGKETEVDISPEGKVLADKDGEDKDDEDKKGEDKDGEKDEADEVAVEAANVPAAVKTAAEPFTKGAAVDKYTKETEGGAVSYEVEFKVDGKNCSVTVTEDGNVIEVEKPADAPPAAAAAAIKKKYPAATIKHTDAVELHFYEVKVEMDGKSHEIKVDASGHIMNAEEEEKD